MKTAIQAVYNSLKGGLDANTQQFMSIMPPIKTGFEQKYVIRLLIAVVTNAWRSQQIIRMPIDSTGQFSMYSYRKSLTNHCPTLKEFNYKLAMALINSSADPYFQNVLGANAARSRSTAGQVDIGFTRNPATLKDRIAQEVMPKKHRFRGFTNRANLVEFRLTENDQFEHNMVKGNRKKTHCALCLKGKTMYCCELCNVPLCRTVKEKSHKNMSCFMIWHSQVDLIIGHHKLRQAYGTGRRKKPQRPRGRQQPQESSEAEDESSYKEDESDDDTATEKDGVITEEECASNAPQNIAKGRSNNEGVSDESDVDSVIADYRNSVMNRVRANTFRPLDIAAMANLSYNRKQKTDPNEDDSGSDSSTDTE